MRAAIPAMVREGRNPGVSRRVLSGLVLLLLLPGLCSGAEPFEPDLGMGFGLLGATASSPLHSFDDAGGPGLQLVLEKYLGLRFAWDLRLGGFWTDLEAPLEINYPADDGDWSVASTALRWMVGTTGAVSWWAGPELSFHYAQMEHFDYVGSGLGTGLTAGLDLPLGEGRWLVRLGGHAAWAALETDTARTSRRTTVVLVGVDVLYRFRRG